MVFSWFDGLAWKGWKRTLKMDDLWTLPLDLRCSGVIPIWDKHWDKIIKNKKRDVSILGTLVNSFGVEFACSAVLTAIYTVLQFASPQLVDLLIG